jgi:hypothetical protein
VESGDIVMLIDYFSELNPIYHALIATLFTWIHPSRLGYKLSVPMLLRA